MLFSDRRVQLSCKKFTGDNIKSVINMNVTRDANDSQEMQVTD